MLKDLMIEKVAEEFHGSILSTPKRQRRLRSSTFWNKFGFERRTKERIESVKNVLREKSIILNEDFEFGAERKNDWIVLTYVEADYLPTIENNEPSDSKITFPNDAWFDLMNNRSFKSEREVEYFFIIPLLEKLGYEESDFAIGCLLQRSKGSIRNKIEPDVVLYNGKEHIKENTLLLIEAKKFGKVLTKDDIGQAEDYANVLYPSYYVLTNGNEIIIYARRPKMSDFLRLKLLREDLKDKWVEFYKILNKKAVVEQKERLKTVLASNGF